ncbi:IMPACT family protein [Brooklawnia cerclae]|uniref:YigZ family protein n=1 Tax=Brooklawnia cerclae TaxID=349934 RepID=A0ABX0SED7_9ACTN|nr:YigZ family protein [Brooklawnia cerclae]NIH56763.1 putative YigZ family protein [Brooklawnia cerclae]
MPDARTNRYVVPRAGDLPSTESTIKRSRFLGFAARVTTEEQARAFVAETRRAHREARHVCHAFVLGPDREIQRSSDDGEPGGSAGVPILKAVLARQTAPGVCELSDVVVAVVRYFGGIKLGVGGLVQAYSDAAAGTLDRAVLVERVRMRLLALPVSFADAGRLESSIRSHGFDVVTTDYLADGATLTVAVPDDPGVLAGADALFVELLSGRSRANDTGTVWMDRGAS